MALSDQTVDAVSTGTRQTLRSPSYWHQQWDCVNPVRRIAPAAVNSLW